MLVGYSKPSNNDLSNGRRFTVVVGFARIPDRKEFWRIPLRNTTEIDRALLSNQANDFIFVIEPLLGCIAVADDAADDSVKHGKWEIDWQRYFSLPKPLDGEYFPFQ